MSERLQTVGVVAIARRGQGGGGGRAERAGGC